MITDEPLPRVREWLANILENVGAIRADATQANSVKTFAERCSVPATRLLMLLREMEAGGTLTIQFVAQAIEIAAELADEWQSLQVNANLEKPVSRYRSSARAGLTNLASRNKVLASDADKKAINGFDAWKENPIRRRSLDGLARREQVKRYLKVCTVPDRAARRLRAMLKDGRIK